MWGFNAPLRQVSTRAQRAFARDVEEAKSRLAEAETVDEAAGDDEGAARDGAPRDAEARTGTKIKAGKIAPKTPSPREKHRVAESTKKRGAGETAERGSSKRSRARRRLGRRARSARSARTARRTAATGRAREREEIDLSDGLVVGGYDDLVISRAAEGVDVRLGARVTSVRVRPADACADADAYRCEVTTGAGETVACDCVVVALPLGVLQGRSEKSRVRFEPELSERKRRAVAALGMGTENKVVMRFAECFWSSTWGKPNKYRFLQCTDQRFRFLNMTPYGKPNVIIAHVAPPYGEGFREQTESEVLRETLDVLRRMFRVPENAPLPELLDWRVTNWGADPFSCGAYSYMRVGSDAEDVRALAEAEHEDAVHFAGRRVRSRGSSASTARCSPVKRRRRRCCGRAGRFRTSRISSAEPWGCRENRRRTSGRSARRGGARNGEGYPSTWTRGPSRTIGRAETARGTRGYENTRAGRRKSRGPSSRGRGGVARRRPRVERMGRATRERRGGDEGGEGSERNEGARGGGRADASLRASAAAGVFDSGCGSRRRRRRVHRGDSLS